MLHSEQLTIRNLWTFSFLITTLNSNRIQYPVETTSNFVFKGLWWTQSSYPHSSTRLLYPECFPTIRFWAIQGSLSTNAFLFPRNWCSSAKRGQLSKLPSLNKTNCLLSLCCGIQGLLSFWCNSSQIISQIRVQPLWAKHHPLRWLYAVPSTLGPLAAGAL